MSRIPIINHETAEGKTKVLLDGIRTNFGKVPNIFKGMANSPAVLEGMLKFMGALGGRRFIGENEGTNCFMCWGS
jgi:hypothetical protein